RVHVEIFRNAKPLEMFPGVGSENRRIGARPGLHPGNGQVLLLAQGFQSTLNSLWPFGMTRVRITGAMLVGNDFHAMTAFKLQKAAGESSFIFSETGPERR